MATYLLCLLYLLQLMAIVVNELLPGGWLEFLGHVRLRDDQAFDRQEELDRSEVRAAEGVVDSGASGGR